MEDLIADFGITQSRLAVSIGVPPRRIDEIVHGKRSITVDTALRFAAPYREGVAVDAYSRNRDNWLWWGLRTHPSPARP